MSAAPHHPAIRLAIATPCFGGQVTQLYMGAMLNLQAACHTLNVGLDVLFNSGDAMITRARASLVTQFMHSQATHLMFIDADIGFEPEAVLRLLAAPGPVSGAMYPAKWLDWERAGQFARDDKSAQDGAAHLVGGYGDLAPPPNDHGFVPADVLGGGFLMIARDAIIQLAARHPELRYGSVNAPTDPHRNSPHRHALFDPMIDERGTYLPEDYAFCRRWKATGGDIWVDTRTRLLHQGVYTFTAPR